MKTEDYKRIEADFLATVDIVINEVSAATGYDWIVVPKTGAFRSIKEQHKLFIQPTDGIDNDGDGKVDEADEFVTKADGGSSPHNFNLARDIVPCRHPNTPWWSAPKAVWEKMGAIAEKHGLVWGGHFKSFTDLPHIESPDFRAVRTAWRSGELTELA